MLLDSQSHVVLVYVSTFPVSMMYCLVHLLGTSATICCFLAGKLLAYNCSPSFNWKRHLDDATIAKFQQEIGKMGYKFQFVTLAGFHSLNHAMFELSLGYAKRGMAAYSELQQLEFASEAKGYTCSKHQREVRASAVSCSGVHSVMSKQTCTAPPLAL